MSPNERSFWAWGWAEDLPDSAAREKLAARVGAVLGDLPSPERRPPVLGELVLSAPRVRVPGFAQGFVTDNHEARVRHTYGRAWIDLARALDGDFSPSPDLVATPRTETEISALMAWCTEASVALVPWGGGTSVVGGVEAIVSSRWRATVALDLCRFDAITDIDIANYTARIGAGATGPMIDRALSAEGLTLRHYPQSYEFSTLGGWLATRAAGHFATGCTRIDDRVQSLRMVSPAGVWQSGTEGVPSSGAGVDPVGLVLGSEGVFGVITEAVVRVLRRPRWRRSASVRFEDFDAALTAARAVVQAGLSPSNCRVLDRTEVVMNQVDDALGGAALLLAFESADSDPAGAMARAVELALGYGGECRRGVVSRGDDSSPEANDDDSAAAQWKRAFLGGPYLQSALALMGVMADTFETCCSWTRFAALHAELIAAVQSALDAHCGGGLVSCRVTHVYPDGLAPYYTFIARYDRALAVEQWSKIKRAASEVIVRHNATITHHHAVGRNHRAWYLTERSGVFLESLRALKSSLDPAGVMNPGALLPER